jgi:hypothetical protein
MTKKKESNLKEPEFFYTFYDNVSQSETLKTLLGYKVTILLCSKTKKNTGIVRFDRALKQDICSQLGVGMQYLANELTRLKKGFIISVENKECMVNPIFFWYGSLKSRERLIKIKDIQDKFSFEIEI